MKKIFFLFALIIIYVSTTNANNNYHLNEELIEDAFSKSQDVTMAIHSFVYFNTKHNISNISISVPADDNTQIYAAIAGAFGLLLGIGVFIPVHRLILGTNGHFGKVCALYCITLSGCGIITLIDIFMMLVDDTKSKYINNSKFIMWAN